MFRIVTKTAQTNRTGMSSGSSASAPKIPRMPGEMNSRHRVGSVMDLAIYDAPLEGIARGFAGRFPAAVNRSEEIGLALGFLERSVFCFDASRSRNPIAAFNFRN